MTVLGTDERDAFDIACDEHAELGQTEWRELSDGDRHTLIALWIDAHIGLWTLVDDALSMDDERMMLSHLAAARPCAQGLPDAATYCIGRMIVRRLRAHCEPHVMVAFDLSVLDWQQLNAIDEVSTGPAEQWTRWD